jgi:hypothetical protein
VILFPISESSRQSPEVKLLNELFTSGQKFPWKIEWSLHGKRTIPSSTVHGTMAAIVQTIIKKMEEVPKEDKLSVVIDVEYNQVITIKLLARKPGEQRQRGVYMAQTSGQFEFPNRGRWRYHVF